MIETALFLLVLVVMLYAGYQVFLAGERAQVTGPEWQQKQSSDSGGGIASYLRTLRLDFQPLMFIALMVLVAMAVFLFFLELFPSSFILAAIAGCAVLFFSFTLLRDLAKWRARRFEAKLVDAIDLIQASLQAGENPQAALKTAAQASKGPVREEFSELVKRLELGMPIERATARMVELYESEGVRLFTQVLIAKWNAGGDLLMLLKSVNRIIRERIKLRMRISGQLSGARYALFFVALLPYIMVPVFLSREPGWLNILTQHEWGPMLLLIAILLQLIGFLWMRQILRTDL